MLTYTEAQLVSFGNYLLKTYGVQVHSTDGKNIPLYQRQVTDADYRNWEEVERQGPNVNLPSQHAIGQPVWLRLWSHDIIGTVLCVHFYEGKVKYDLELLGSDGDKTRIYNVDSYYVVDRIEGRVN